jgi:CspA family cold shock protein
MINVRKRVMAKGQRRSNRETKKPKQPKSEKKTAVPLTLLAPERGLARSQKGRELSRR